MRSNNTSRLFSELAKQLRSQNQYTLAGNVEANHAVYKSNQPRSVQKVLEGIQSMIDTSLFLQDIARYRKQLGGENPQVDIDFESECRNRRCEGFLNGTPLSYVKDQSHRGLVMAEKDAAALYEDLYDNRFVSENPRAMVAVLVALLEVRTALGDVDGVSRVKQALDSVQISQHISREHRKKIGVDGAYEFKKQLSEKLKGLICDIQEDDKLDDTIMALDAFVSTLIFYYDPGYTQDRKLLSDAWLANVCAYVRMDNFHGALNTANCLIESPLCGDLSDDVKEELKSVCDSENDIDLAAKTIWSYLAKKYDLSSDVDLSFEPVQP